jgi:hypothetical protein
MNMRSWIPAVLVALGLMTTSPSANAAIRYRPLPAFGPVAIPSNVAVDQSSGIVFVAAAGENAVDEFKPKGVNEYEPVGEITGSEAPHPFAFPHTEPAPVAVDSSTGDVYVADPGHSVVDEFNAAGKYVCQLSGVGRGCLPDAESELGSPTTFGELTGVAIDSHGNVYVSDYSNEVVDEFDSAGGDVGQIGCGYHPSGVAISSTGAVYVQAYLSIDVECPSGSVFDASKSFDLAIDPLTNGLFVDQGSSVAVYGADGEAIDAFATGLPENGSEGVAVDSAKHLIYVTDKPGGNVLVFEEFVVPDVKPEAATEVTATSATLNGEIDPDGTSEAGYYFEYGTTSALGSTSPAPPGTLVGEGNAFVPATTKLTGLEPNTTYHYSLVGINNFGVANPSTEGTFKTSKLPPGIAGIKAANITTTSVSFQGEVNPENEAVYYHFEYGKTTNYEYALPEIGIGMGGVPISVEQHAPAGLTSEPVFLAPGTVYHYQIVAKNAAGEETASLDQTFITPTTAPPPINIPGGTGSPDQNSVAAPLPQTIAVPPTPLFVPLPVFPAVHYPAPSTCKKGYVRKGAKCVRKKRPRPKPKKRHG